MTCFLNQALASFCEESSDVNYLFPTRENLETGGYASEILDVKEVLTAEGSLEAIDFYHRLTNSDGNVTHFRFRYYREELPVLAKTMQQYPNVTTWRAAVGLHEDVEITPKKTGRYMQISNRKALTKISEHTLSESASSVSGSHAKKGGLSARLSKKPQQHSRRVSTSDFEDDPDYDDFLPDDED